MLCAGFVLMTGLAAAQASTGSPAAAAQPGTVQTGTVQAAPVVPAPADPAAPAQPGPVQPGAAPPAIVAGTPVRVMEPVPPAKSRYLVQVMEGVLQSAVRYAATQMNQKLQAVTPDLLQLSGAARARGFRLDGYGVFFDVEVPAALRQTMGWTARMMQQNDHSLEQAVVQLRRMMTELEGKRRVEAETALRILELRARPFLSPTMMAKQQVYAPQSLIGTADGSSSSSTAVQAASTQNVTTVSAADRASMPADGVPAGAVPAGAVPAGAGPSVTVPRAPSEEDLAWMQNPDAAYEVEVREALINAMLSYGSTLALQPDEWLTVAARDNQSVVVPGDLTETVTVILRVKGADLADLMAGRVSPQDARRRVEIREF